MCVAAVGSKAQFEAGTMYMNVSLSNLGVSYSSIERCRFGGGLSGGFFFADKCLLKADLNYNHTKAVDDFSLGLGMRYYFRQSGIFLGSGGEFTHYTPSNNDVMIPFEVGYAFYLNHYLTIEPSLYYKMSLNCFTGSSSMAGFKIGFGFYF